MKDIQAGRDSLLPPWAVSRRDSPALLIPDNLVALAEPDSHRPWAASRRDSPASLSPDNRVGWETLRLVTGRTDYWDHKVHPCPAVRDSQVGTDSHRPWAACRRDSPASLSPDSRVARGSLGS